MPRVVERTNRLTRCLGCLVALIAIVNKSHADALTVTRAMTASTIAEIYVERDHVRIALEIGSRDLAAFRRVMPDDLYRKLGGSEMSLNDRHREFFQQDLIVSVDDHQTLLGTVTNLTMRNRVLRDEVTGEPLVEQSPDAELVVSMDLIYGFEGQPAKVSIQPPQDDRNLANIGFVTYHGGLPVNDFRYLSNEVNLNLDWEDPWYSHFDHPNLQRQNSAPMSAFLYVEPFEVRKEIVIRPKDLQNYVSLPMADGPIIPVSAQDDLKQAVAEFLDDKNRVRIDGRDVNGTLDRIHFVRRSLRRTGIVDPPEDLDAVSATLGVIYVYPIDQLPRQVELRWELFDERVQSVPASATDEAGPLPSVLTPDDPVLRWQNYLKNPTVPGLIRVAPPPQPGEIELPLVSVLCVAVSVPLLVSIRRHWSVDPTAARGLTIGLIALLLTAGIARPYARVSMINPFSKPDTPSKAEATEVLAGLLHNVYRAFDRRDQGLIYDQLSRSISGDLLEQVYLDTRRMIEVENQGGLQIKVTDVEILDLSEIAVEGAALTYRCRWRVSGSVGHWGHIHSRVNEPSAVLTMAPIEDAWKITGMELVQDSSASAG